MTILFYCKYSSLLYEGLKYSIAIKTTKTHLIECRHACRSRGARCCKCGCKAGDPVQTFEGHKQTGVVCDRYS